MTQVAVRLFFLIIHMLANVLIVVHLTNYDLTGSWLRITGFIICMSILLYLFIMHIFSFIQFFKYRP